MKRVEGLSVAHSCLPTHSLKAIFKMETVCSSHSLTKREPKLMYRPKTKAKTLTKEAQKRVNSLQELTQPIKIRQQLSNGIVRLANPRQLYNAVPIKNVYMAKL